MRLHEQIKVVNARATEAQHRIDHAQHRIDLFLGYLDGPKFRGNHPQDGTPNDWVNIREVQAILRQIDNVLDGVDDDLLCQSGAF
jgi:hypothetical protein